MEVYLALLMAAGAGLKAIAPYMGYVGMVTFGAMALALFNTTPG